MSNEQKGKPTRGRRMSRIFMIMLRTAVSVPLCAFIAILIYGMFLNIAKGTYGGVFAAMLGMAICSGLGKLMEVVWSK
jgi:hypothetical protein